MKRKNGKRILNIKVEIFLLRFNLKNNEFVQITVVQQNKTNCKVIEIY